MLDTWSLLIIDDSKADRTIYRRYLLQDPHYKYDIFEASSSKQGLKLCQNQRFDAVLLDYQLPGESGLEVLKQLNQQYPQTAVVMLTGHGDEQIAVHAMKGGAQDYLIKDLLQQDTLRQTVRNVVLQTRLKNQLKQSQERQQLLVGIAFNIRQSLELGQILDAAVAEVRALLQCERVFAYQFNADMSGTIIAESVDSGWVSVLGKTVEDTYFKENGADDYLQGRKQIVTDVDIAGLDSCHLNLLKEFEVKACLVTPILVSDQQKGVNQLWGLLTAHQCSTPRLWHIDEEKLLDELSNHLSIAIQQAELLAQTKAALEKEKELNHFKSQIIATVAHEYNGPLAAIKTAAGTLKSHAEQLKPLIRERFLNLIEQKADHMANMVNDMLLVNQAERKKLQLHLTTINLVDFLSDLITEHEMLEESKHLINLNVQGDLKGFSGDQDLLQQVFSNLISNAVKYSPVDSKIQITLLGEASCITCYIVDEGIGIPEKDKDQLFQVFSRGSNVGTLSGTGLGLRIVKSAVDLHKGEIDINSQEGKGTQVIVRLPKQPELAVGDISDSF